MIIGFAVLLFKIMMKEWKDFAYTEASTLVEKAKGHFDNLWNIIDLL